MDWIQTFTIIFSIIGVLGGFMFFMMQRFEKDISRIDTDIKSAVNHLDGHARRIDQHYTIIIDLLKVRK